jgi:hypothetical protein
MWGEAVALAATKRDPPWHFYGKNSPPLSAASCLLVMSFEELVEMQGLFGREASLTTLASVSAPFTQTRYRAQTHWYRSTTCAS